MTGSSSRTSCEPVFLSLELLTLSLPYPWWSSCYRIWKHTFNCTVHGCNARNKLQLHKL